MPRKIVISVSIQLQNGLLATQRYLTMFPSSLIRFSGRRFAIKALPITLPVEPRAIGIVTVKNRTISPVAQLFIQTVREYRELRGKTEGADVSYTRSLGVRALAQARYIPPE